MMTTKTDCKHYEQCEAPLCPMQTREENKKRVWFPDDPICKKGKYPPFWVKQQKRIRNKIKLLNSDSFFTLDMLETPFFVNNDVKGIYPIPGFCMTLLKKYWFTATDVPFRKRSRKSISLMRRKRPVKQPIK